jgi:hypothetical protein
MEPVKAIKEIIDAYQANMDADREQRKAESKADREEMRAIMKVHHEMMVIFGADRVETKVYPE